MRQFLLSVVIDEAATATPEEMEAVYKTVDAHNNELQAAERWVHAGGLHPSSTATTLRYNNGEVAITDGPFAETKEHLGGFWVIKANDRDEALDWARRGAVACGGTVELREFQDEA